MATSPHPRMVHVWAVKVILANLLLWLLWVAPVLVWLAGFLVIVPVVLTVGACYLWARLFRKFYRWQLADEELHVWRGILFRKRITIPYMRVQNVNVVRGPLLLLFGLSGVEVETAGQKGTYSGLYHTEGYLPGVVDGASLADSIIDKAKASKVREGL